MDPKGSHFGREVNKLLAKYFISEGVNGITSKFKAESFDWCDKTKERTHRDIPLNWMSNLNSHGR